MKVYRSGINCMKVDIPSIEMIKCKTSIHGFAVKENDVTQGVDKESKIATPTNRVNGRLRSWYFQKSCHLNKAVFKLIILSNK